MEIIKPYFVIEDEIDGEGILKRLEKYAKNCYKSEANITATSAKNFFTNLLKQDPPHESVIEHEKVTVRVICDRGVTHEIVRHRIASYSQESTRYVNYNKKGMEVIEPFFFCEDADSPEGSVKNLKNSAKYNIWQKAMEYCERAYNNLIELGATPQEARSVLPNSLKTEIIITYNLREWRHFFKLRCSARAHPQMREVAIPLLKEFQKRIPVLFDDIQ